MPTIAHLPAAAAVTAADELPISQGGSVCAVTVGALLANTQPAIMAPSGTLLGRTSIGAGGPDAVDVGIGLQLSAGTLVATGSDHAGFANEGSLVLSDQAVLNSQGTPRLLPLVLLRGLFAPGANVAIDPNGTISATAGNGISSIGALATVSAISATDLVAISQGGNDCAITYGNLIDGQTVDEIQAANAAADSDCLLGTQGGSVLTRQSLAALWTWFHAKLPGYLSPTIELTVNTALASAAHNGHVLICSQPVTITAASANLGSGFSCTVINASNGSVTLGANIATSSGASTVAPGQAASLTCVAYSGGTLVYASTSAPATSAAPPSQVVGLTVTAMNSSSMTLTWDTLTPPPTSYVVQYRISGSGTWINAPSVTTGTCTVAGLLSATSYDFVVSAVNGAGVGVPSAIATATTSAPLAPPGQVTSLVASNATATTITLAWSAPASGGAVASYTVQNRVSGTTTWSTAASGVTTTATTVTSLLASTSYDFQVFAVNAAGAGAASSSATTSTIAAGNSVTAIVWNIVPSGSYTHGSGSIPVNAHVTPSTAPVQFGFSSSATTLPSSWTIANYVNADLWGAYVDTPAIAGSYYAWVEGTDGSLPTVYATSFTVT